MPPQLGVGGGIPKPRKLILASAIIAAPMPVVNMMMRGAVILGNMSLSHKGLRKTKMGDIALSPSV
jgi:hypothetical protein